MSVKRLEEIIAQVPAKRLLGIDVGAKTLGLSVCDPEHSIATPLRTIRRIKFTRDILELQNVIVDYEIGGFVIGLPLNVDGTEGPRAQSVRDFALEMLNHPDIFGDDPWIALWDERFSTETVEGFVDKNTDISKRKAKSKGITDALAAQHILQTALDFMARSA